MSALAKRIDKIEPLVAANCGEIKESVYGIVDRVDVVDGVKVPHFCRRWKGTIGNMRPTDEEPTIYCIEKLEPLLIKHKKHKRVFGGRGGAKSILAFDAMIGEVNASGAKVFVMREHMNSLEESVFEGIERRISDLAMAGFTSVNSKWAIRNANSGVFKFGGLKNVVSKKGAFGYKFFLIEEAEATSQRAIDLLSPTLRGMDGCEMWMIWNPRSINDPMSKMYITPYQAELDRYGYYEDDFNLIIRVDYTDNPWFEHDESLRQELANAKKQLREKIITQSKFNHIWHGGFMDDIENGIIKEEWFDSCVDAHKLLGFEPAGGTIFAFDPADTGKDAHGYAVRHGRVVTSVGEIDAENGNRATDEACGLARKSLADYFRWDCDGLGATLRDNVARGLSGSKIDAIMFKGSETPDDPDKPFDDGAIYGFKNTPTNKQAVRNKRAHGYVMLARAMRITHEAVQKAKSGMCPAINVDELISFDSDGLGRNRQKLKSELCRLPLKPASGQILLYSKDEMAKGILMADGSRLVIPSPNMGDSVMMTMFNAAPKAIDWGGEINYETVPMP